MEKYVSGYCSLKDLGFVWIILKNLPYIFFIFGCECVNVKTGICGKRFGFFSSNSITLYIQFLNSKSFTLALTAKKFRLCIPSLRKGIERPQSQFPHSCVCERIYSQDRSTFFPAAEQTETYCGNIQYLQKHECRAPRSAFFGNICFKFSLLCLCNALFSHWEKEFRIYLQNENTSVLLLKICTKQAQR